MKTVQSMSNRSFAAGAMILSVALLIFQLLRPEQSTPRQRNSIPFAAANEGIATLDSRVADYPSTWISGIRVDLESPGHWVYLEWEGPLSRFQDGGPFHSTPGKGDEGCDCNDDMQSNINGSNCTPKGVHVVQGFNDCLPSSPDCVFATWIDLEREIAFHYHPNRPFSPASLGCIRVSKDVAMLIHNNSVKGATEVVVHGNWRRPTADNN